MLIYNMRKAKVKSLQFYNLKQKVRFWIEFRHKNIDFIDGYLHANMDCIYQDEYKELLKYAKTLKPRS